MTTAEERNVTADLEALLSYRDGYKNMFRIAIALVLAIAGLLVAVFYRVSYVLPQDRYFAAMSGGQLMPLVALSEPYINNALLLDWAAVAATEILTFGFNDVNERFATSQQYFSPEGLTSFTGSFGKSSLFENVQKFQQVITAIPSAPPSIVGQGLNEGQMGWMIEVPLTMTIRAPGVEKAMRATVTMFVVRLPTSINAAGLGIFTWRVD
ncbi:MAG: DotI/IcmL/TraM family protein [Alphaproteobacteria bacterium]|nr:DotI/IcmL/TraM family protein [Alphaproteobacteria bacterium]